jgi:hypothetical protein
MDCKQLTTFIKGVRHTTKLDILVLVYLYKNIFTIVVGPPN